LFASGDGSTTKGFEGYPSPGLPIPNLTFWFAGEHLAQESEQRVELLITQLPKQRSGLLTTAAGERLHIRPGWPTHGCRPAEHLNIHIQRARNSR